MLHPGYASPNCLIFSDPRSYLHLHLSFLQTVQIVQTQFYIVHSTGRTSYWFYQCQRLLWCLRLPSVGFYKVECIIIKVLIIEMNYNPVATVLEPRSLIKFCLTAASLNNCSGCSAPPLCILACATSGRTSVLNACCKISCALVTSLFC